MQRTKFGPAAVIAVMLMAVTPGSGGAQVVVAPISGVINSGSPGFGSLSNTYDQSGLSAGYTSGVTSFATYMGASPTHTYVFSGYEWWSNAGTSTASVTYNFGSIWSFSSFALWNEEEVGIQALDLYYSTDGVSFYALSLGLAPTNNPLFTDYGADVFGFAPTAAQYIRLDMSGCPQDGSSIYSDFGCAIGEVAFGATPTEVVPEPATMTLLATGLAGMAAARRRKKTTA